MEQKTQFHRLTLLLLPEGFNPVNLTNVEVSQTSVSALVLWNLFILGSEPF